MNYKDLATQINNEVKCENLKEMLFGMDVVSAEDLKGIGVINKMLTFGFLVAYIKWKNDIVRGEKLPSTPNAKRVFDVFQCIYNGEDIGLDLIIYVLTEIQLDEMMFGDRSYFSNVISSGVDSIQIPSLRALIKTWFQSAKHAEKNQEVLLGKLFALYKSFPFLQNLKLTFKTELALLNGDETAIESLELNFLDSGEKLDSCLLMIKNDYGIFYLSSYENIQSNNSRFNYVSLDGVESCAEIFPTIYFLRRAAIRNHNSRPTSVFAKSLFSLSFKYIKNLSLALSDTITASTKQKLYEHFSHKYSDIFELGFKKETEVNWDNILTILMIEEGPTELLEFILDSDGFYFERILQNLEMRYNESDFASKVKSEYEAAQAHELEFLKRHIDDTGSLIRNISAINRSFMARAVIDGLANLENSKKKSTALFVESLADRIRNVDKIISSADSNKSKVLKINRCLEKTFRYIIPFYNGIIAYQQEKEDLLNDVEAEKEEKSVLLDRCEQKFFDAAKKSIAEICRKSLGQLVADFRALCKSLVNVKDRVVQISPRGRLLKSAIGRNYICSLETFEDILSIDEDFSTLDLKDAPTDIIRFINNEKHLSSNNAACANIVLFNKFLIHVKQLLYFFVYNEDYQREMILGQQISHDPIYPYVVRYSLKSENRDGYNINSFTVFPFEEAGLCEIKILVERDYEINEKYYCIPNESTSNSRWWIEPFLISCRKYDQLIHSYKDEKKDKEESDI